MQKEKKAKDNAAMLADKWKDKKQTAQNLADTPSKATKHDRE